MQKRGIDVDASYLYLAKAGRFRESFEVMGSAPWLWPISAMCPLFAGALASFYPDRIRSSLYPLFWPDTLFDLPSSFFWLLVFTAASTFGLTQWSQGRAGKDLRNMVRRLQTLPPGGFLEAFRTSYAVAARQTLAIALEASPSKGQTDHAIRNVLGAIIELARDFDQQNDATYGASMMLWRAPEAALESASPLHLAPFNKGDPDVSGYLALVPDLSTTTSLKASRYAPDPESAPLVIPLPRNVDKLRDARNHARDPVLPGAAQAYLHGDFVRFGSISDYIAWLDVHSSRGLEIVNPAKEFYLSGAGSTIASFGARPIMSIADDCAVIAVLNIQSSEEDLLVDSGQTLFAPLIEPFCFLLATLLMKRQGASLDQQDPSSSEPTEVHHG